MLKTASSILSLLFLVPALAVFWIFAVLTTIVSSLILTVHVLVVYSGLALALLRRSLGHVLFSRGLYSGISNASANAAKRVQGANSPRKVSGGGGKRHRARTPLGPKRVDYGTLLRPQKRQDSQSDYFGIWEATVAKNGME